MASSASIAMLLYDASEKINYTDKGIPFLSKGITFYRDYLLVCTILLIMVVGGVVGNIFNILIFSKESINSSFKTILKATAWAHLLLQIGRVTFIITICFLSKETMYEIAQNRVFEKPTVIIIHIIFIMQRIFYMWYMGLTLMMALWRLIAVNYPLKAKIFFTEKNIRFAITVTLVFSFCIKVYQCTLYLAEHNFCLFHGKHLRDNKPVIYHIITNPLLVCSNIISIIVIIISIKFTMGFIEARRRHHRFLMNSSRRRASKDVNKTTAILLLVLYFFILTNFFKNVCEFVYITSTAFSCVCSPIIFRDLAYITYLVETIDTSSNFFIYYAIDYKCIFRKEVRSLLMRMKTKIIYTFRNDENNSTENT